MKIPLGAAIATGMLAACGPPQLFAIPDNPYSNSDSAVVQNGPVMMVASHNEWYECALAQVSTPVEVVVINRGKQTLPISLDDLTLVDERGRVYHALPAETVVTRLFGEAPPPPPFAEPPPPAQQAAPPPENAPPSKQPPPADIQAPPPEKPSETLGPTLDPGIILVAGHGGGGGHGGVGHAAGGHYVGHGYYRGGAIYGGGGFRSGGYYGGGYRGRLAWGLGVPYWGYGPWGWWFGPAYVLGIDEAPYDYYPYDPREFDELGPWQVYELALRPTELGPNERMGGLVFFEPAWDAKVVTLRLVTQPTGAAPIQLSARFEVSK